MKSHPVDIHEEITGAVFNRVLKEIKAAGRKPIRLSINSPGGSVIAGAAILSSLRAHRPGVEVNIIGLAASMASVISMVGQPVTMAENALWMMHNPSSSSTGTAADLRKDADTLDKFRDTLVAAYRRKSKKTATEIMALLDAETWLSAPEALAAGFVDVVTGANPAQACAWSSKYPRLAAIGAASKTFSMENKTLVGQLAAITNPTAKDAFFRKNRIPMIREAARAATPELPTPRTLSQQIGAISDPHKRTAFYKSNRSLLLREECQAATPGCVHNM